MTIFNQALTQAPVLDGQDDMDAEKPVTDLAQEMLRRMVKFGWIEEFQDPSSRRRAYRLTGMGRRFAAPFVHMKEEIITNTQHTRSTEAHLQNFIHGLHNNRIQVDDLMIATKLSQDIVTDFNDLIDELHQERRRLTSSINKEIQEARKAGEAFLDYMQRRLVPEFNTRFRTDSVELYRGRILELLDTLRELPNQQKAEIETRLRRFYPYLYKPPKRPSIFVWALERIERQLNSACDIKLPELREEADRFIRRAQILIKHLVTIAFGEQEQDSIFSIAARLRELHRDDIVTVLDQSTLEQKVVESGQNVHGLSLLSELEISLIDPGKVTPPQLRNRAAIDNRIETEVPMTPNQKRARYISHKLAEAFAVDEKLLSQVAIKALAGGDQVRASEIMIEDVESLLAVLHVPVLGSVGSSQKLFRVTRVGRRFENRFFTSDDYLLSYLGMLPTEEAYYD
ncbi:hypothetical protein DSLASN_30600 [Desulfoluna limicola]|uniref:Uncharacterized protein n=2 Tax=Desulfoluna limicola TaxID=2810562 RepID=A0ABN6F600_9BACT|nr:hypothetical protein DSLASN_30600 [Desulfoluna limicola]